MVRELAELTKQIDKLEVEVAKAKEKAEKTFGLLRTVGRMALHGSGAVGMTVAVRFTAPPLSMPEMTRGPRWGF